METVFAVLAVAAAAIIIVVFGAALTALVIYAFIMVCVWLWQKADARVRKKGRHYCR